MDAEKKVEEVKAEEPKEETRPSEDKEVEKVSEKEAIAVGTPVAASVGTAGGDKTKEKNELKEAMRVANELEKAEEEEMMRRAIEASERAAQLIKNEQEEEEEMMRKAIEMSQREEEQRKATETV